MTTTLLQINKLRKIASAILAVTMLFALSIVTQPNVKAAANEFTGTADWSAKTVTFDPGANVLIGEEIIMTFPSQIAISAATTPGLTPNGATVANNIATWTITSGGYATGTGIVVTFTTSSTPTAGEYSVHIATKNSSGVVQRTGFSTLSINNTVGVTAVVAEAMVMTLSNTQINLNVDPTVNNGKDTGSVTVMYVSTNASGGYVINEQIDSYLLNSTDSSITPIQSTGASVPTDNYFGYATATGSTATSLFSDSPTSTGNTGAGPTESSVHVMSYDLDVDFTTAAGTYAANITYTISPSF